MMRHLALVGLVLVAFARGAAAESVTVLTALPVTYALASSLAAGTDITVSAVQPEKLPATRLTSFLAGRGADKLAAAVKGADAVITIRSFWPEAPLYPHARRTDIRIVEIDAGRPLDGALPGIALADPPDAADLYAALDLQPMPPSGEASAPWLAPTSLGRMADVLAADLGRLAPSAKAKLDDNLLALKRRLVALKADADMKLAAAPSVTAVALSPHFSYLARDLGLDLVTAITAAEHEWTPERAARFGAWLAENEVPVVFMHAAPDEDLKAAIEEAGAKAVVLGQVAGGDADPVAAIEANIGLIAGAFGGKK